MMRVLLVVILSASFVNFAWTASQPPNQPVNQGAASHAKDGTEIRKNFQSLLESIAKNEPGGSGRYRHMLRQDIENGREAFDVLEEELQVARRSSSANRKRNSFKDATLPVNRVVRKRDALKFDDDDDTTESTVEETGPTRPPTKDLGKIMFQVVNQNNESAVRYLIEQKGVPVTVLSELDETIAHIAAADGNMNLLMYVVDREPSLLAEIDVHGETPLFRAIRGGHLDVVKYLVEMREVDFSQPLTHCFGYSAIHMAAEEGQLPIMKYFLEERGGDVNIENAYQQTPVIMAAESGHKDMITYLVESQGADLTGIDNENRNILYIGVTTDDLELFKYVLDDRKIPFDINWQDANGLTVVHYATSLNREDIVKYLVSRKHADVNIPDKVGKTPLHGAAYYDYLELAKYLVLNGADLQAKDEQNRLPINYASEKEMIRYLKEEAARQKKVLAPHPSVCPSEAPAISGPKKNG